ncbi:MAG: hypothetical protein M3Q34_01910 [bacterium]|nr:hypothetical protein [bacterium]
MLEKLKSLQKNTMLVKINNKWTFPAIVTFIFILFIAFGISGTSVGTYYPKWFGNEAKDTALIFGTPKPIRSDEWLITSQYIINQSINNFPAYNNDAFSGLRISLQNVLPSKHWTTIFRPQNVGYLFLPLENGFAFMWWLSMLVLMLSAYFFTLRVFAGKYLFSSLFAISISISPFLMWWFQTGAFFVLAWGFISFILFQRILFNEKIPKINSKILQDFIYVLLFGYSSAVFALVFYPPFMIPVVIGVVFFILGSVIKYVKHDGGKFSQVIKTLTMLAIGSLLALGVLGGFYIEHKAEFDLLGNTVYPGNRYVESGGYQIVSVLDGFTMPLLQSNNRSSNFMSNQSESSNFILLVPYLIIPSCILLYIGYKKFRKINWILLMTNIGLAFILARMYLPFGDKIYNLVLLNRVPHNRLLIGLGFLGFIQILFLIKHAEAISNRVKKQEKWKFEALGIFLGILSFHIAFATGIYIRDHWPIFLNEYWIIIIFSSFFGFMTYFASTAKKYAFVITFIVFTIGSVFWVVPLYRGLDVVKDSDLIKAMQEVSEVDSRWIALGEDAHLYEHFPLVAGRKSAGGVTFYPKFDFWGSLLDTEEEFTALNRQGHVIWSDSKDYPDDINIVRTTSIIIKFQCLEEIKSKIDYALTVHPISEPCLDQIRTVKYPNIEFYLYEVK